MLYSKVLVLYDGSDLSKKALQTAAEIAKLEKKTPLLMY
ncbi:universal stress protein [Terrilactibacillus sp. S3-3]|nr:universal stress protein [Terrilactibacillus sp. S3-3]